LLRKSSVVAGLRRRRDRSGADGAEDYRCTIRLSVSLFAYVATLFAVKVDWLDIS
jgi:hypothetical protein